MDKLRISLESRVTRGRNHVACEVVDEVVILSLENGEYYGLNPIASRIWSLIETTVTVADVRDSLLAEYAGVTLDACGDSVIRLLTEMSELALIEVG